MSTIETENQAGKPEPAAAPTKAKHKPAKKAHQKASPGQETGDQTQSGRR
jgi:hypothetical protein